MKRYRHPALRSIPLHTVMHALSDPCRLKMVRQLAEAGDVEFTCGNFELGVCKATRSHHFQVLREAGIVRMRSDGNRCMTSLRREDLEKRFPGLLELVVGGAKMSR